MKQSRVAFVGLAAAMLIAGCTSQPTAPTTQVMPGPNKSFADFQDDQVVCKNFAQQQTSGAVESAREREVGGGLLTTVLGAGLGAAVGGGRGAAIGAASGAVVGTGYGAATSSGTQHTVQQQYDIAYSQCMYSKGNQVPGFAPPAPK